MKMTIKNLTFVFTLLAATSSYGQPGDLTHPVHKNKSNTVNLSFYSIPEGINPLIIYDGVTLFDTSSLKYFDSKTVNSIKKSKDSVYNRKNELKFNAIMEITTIEGANMGLKRLKEETQYWIRKHPLAVFCLNGEALVGDRDKLDKLITLQSKNIKEIKILNSNQGQELFGKLGENGVIAITTI